MNGQPQTCPHCRALTAGDCGRHDLVVQPQSPFKCPVCDGSGRVSRPPHVAGDQPTWVSSSAGDLYVCRACTGTGIVWGPR